jgi:hypothetical protein
MSTSNNSNMNINTGIGSSATTTEQEAVNAVGSVGSNRSTTTNSKKSENATNIPKDKHSVSKRLQQELLSLMMSGEKGVSAFPDGDNLFKWIGIIQGPIGTVGLGF